MKYNFKYDSTTDYDLFTFISENRETKKIHVDKLKLSVQDINLLPANPIIVANGLIIDGQHRFNVCKELGLPIYYIEIIGMTTEEMITAMHKLNSNAKNWGLDDYLKLYQKQGNKNYIKLYEFKDEFDLSVSISIYMYSGFDDVAYKNASEQSGFKDGKFEPKNEEIARKVASNYATIRNFFSANDKDNLKNVKSAAFIKAFCKLAIQQSAIIDFAELNRMLNLDFRSKIRIFNKSDSVTGYYDMLVKIYNHKKEFGTLKSWADINYDSPEHTEFE